MLVLLAVFIGNSARLCVSSGCAGGLLPRRIAANRTRAGGYPNRRAFVCPPTQAIVIVELSPQPLPASTRLLPDLLPHLAAECRCHTVAEGIRILIERHATSSPTAHH